MQNDQEPHREKVTPSGDAEQAPFRPPAGHDQPAAPVADSRNWLADARKSQAAIPHAKIRLHSLTVHGVPARALT